MTHLLSLRLFLFLLVAACGLSAADRPNILFILADDLGYGDVGPYGVPDARTPNLDRLAAEGVRFTRFYGGGPECTPSRTALMTGRYAERVGGMECAIGTGNVGRYDDAIRLAAQGELGLPPEDSVLGRALQTAGYNTAIIGKWHLGYGAKFNPLEQGFDRFFGFLAGYVDYYRHRELSNIPVLYRDRQPVTAEGYMTHLLNDEAEAFIRQKRDHPFFLYTAYSSPHFPFQAPGEDSGEMITPESLTAGTRQTYVKMLEDLDAGIGRLLNALEESGQADHTLVVFASDHGAMPPGRNLPFSNWKGTLFEGGLRVPAIARWPGKLKAGSVSHQSATIMDLTASFLRLAHASPPDDRPLDGIDILAHVEEGRPDVQRTFYWRYKRGDDAWWAVLDGDTKYIRRRQGADQEEWVFNLAADPGELHSLAISRPETTARLQRLLRRWEAEMGTPR